LHFHPFLLALTVIEILFVALYYSFIMELAVYHDPVQDNIVIETGKPDGAAFKLFDAIGILLISDTVADHERLSVNHLADGLYHYKLVAGDALRAGKILLNR
jgi:hypothetical protein